MKAKILQFIKLMDFRFWVVVFIVTATIVLTRLAN